MRGWLSCVCLPGAEQVSENPVAGAACQKQIQLIMLCASEDGWNTGFTPLTPQLHSCLLATSSAAWSGSHSS